VNTKMVNRVIPLHFYIEKKGLKNQGCMDALRSAGEEGVSAFWLEVAGKDDIDLSNEISSHSGTKVISVVKHPSLIEGVVRSSTSGIAVSPLFWKELLYYRDILIEKGVDVCLYHDAQEYTVDPGEKAFLLMLNKISDSVIKLQRGGIQNIFIHIHHPDSVIRFNIIKYLKERYRTRHVISMTPHPVREKSVIVNSLTLGSFFYEKIGDVLLLRLGSGLEYTLENMHEAIELSKKILGSYRLFPTGYRIISCPTCGRCRMDLLKMTEEIDIELKALEKRYNQEGKKFEDAGGIVVAIMGCNVNGPGEARNADIGIAGRNNKKGVLFKNGRPFKTLPEDKLVDEFIWHTKKLIDKRLSAVYQ